MEDGEYFSDLTMEKQGLERHLGIAGFPVFCFLPASEGRSFLSDVASQILFLLGVSLQKISNLSAYLLGTENRSNLL